MNQQIKDYTKRQLIDLLSTCTPEQQLMFKRMYSHNNLEATIEEAVNNMHESKMDHALTQVSRTVEKNLSV
jgi:hypothetical protein